MKKIISLISVFSVFGMCVDAAYGVAMNAQIRRLLQEKQDKVAQLEACEGKKQGWMIAGISTIGLTAVGIGGNIALASKSNKLSNEIDTAKEDLSKQERELANVNAQISQKEMDRRRNECGTQEGRRWNEEKGLCEDVLGTKKSYVVGSPDKYSDYKLSCDRVSFKFIDGDDYDDVLRSLDLVCSSATGSFMSRRGSTNGEVVFECVGYRDISNCSGVKGLTLTGGVIGQPCAGMLDDIADGNYSGVWQRDMNGKYQCKDAIDNSLPVPCACKDDDNNVILPEREKLDIIGMTPKSGGILDNKKSEYSDIDVKNCRLSGGEWKYEDRDKRWECFCGINQSGSDKNMVQTSGFKTCACKKDHVYIDEKDHSKGCKRGLAPQENANLNKIADLYDKFEKLVDSMDTKVKQTEKAATAAGNATNATNARKYADQAKGYFSEIEKKFVDAISLYNDIDRLYFGLNQDSRTTVVNYKQDADRLNARLADMLSRARNAASKAEQAAVAQEDLTKNNNTCSTPQCEKCFNTGGKWEQQVGGTALCRCDRSKGLVSDSSKMLYCKPADGNSQKNSSNNSGGVSASISDPDVKTCFESVRRYLITQCPKCVGVYTSAENTPAEWDLNGVNHCNDIAWNGGYSTTEWDRTDSSNTVFKIFAKNGSFIWLFCPSKCGKVV